MSLTKINCVYKLKVFQSTVRLFSVTSIRNDKHECKFLVVGGGSAGCAMASKLTHDYPSKKVIVLEPNTLHYYQPIFTLIGGGQKSLSSSHMDMKSVLPKKAKWVKDSVTSFSPAENVVKTSEGHTISYDYLIIATGIQLNYDAVPGLVEGLKSEGSGVCSIYSPKYVEKTWKSIRQVKNGEAIFTFPASPVKCPGAPQKIMYLAESYFRKNNLRDKVKVSYHSSLGVIFGVKKYADALWEVVKGRDIHVNLRRNLIEVRPDTKEAVFQNLDKPEETYTVKYALLHVTPPMGPLKALKEAPAELVNEAGFVKVDKFSMQHVNFKNVFALGDCTDSPNSKTGAAVAAQSLVVQKNLKSLLKGKPLTAKYNGYASCPLVTGNSKCILAEFDYDLVPLETFPINQAKERYTMFIMKKYAMPFLYWNLMTRGYWNGPSIMRSLLNPFKFG